MKAPLLHPSFQFLLAAGFAITPILSQAQAHCPAGTANLRPRVVAGALLVIPVTINQSGPYEFMVDTGSQLNVVDPALAVQLGVKPLGKIGLVGASTVLQASVVVLDSLETASLSVAKPLAAVQDLGPIQAADPHIRGVLGENFLAHFDVLIDYRHRLLCLDQASLIQSKLHGERIPFVVAQNGESDLRFSQRLVISANLSDTGNRPILFQIDSGSDGPILYAGKKELEGLLKRGKLQGPEVGDARRAFAILPPQDMRLGGRIVPKVPFVTPVSDAPNVPDRDEDGILATVLFQRVYISHSDHFIIFDPK